MEVNSASSHKAKNSNVNTSEQKKSTKLSKEEILAKVKGKFGKSAAPKKAAPKPKQDSSDISATAKKKAESSESSEKIVGDIQKNDPKSAVTQEKLKNILKTGSFSFSDRERQALSKILKM